ncbi:PAS domain S-box protein [Geothrix sp. PMB-07]|uniref:PAS domain S-box protein n=1 Tax=Geothrix sp. PMB-07 TaxID=3068640 RepID=UPI00274213BF|nr:PAS domain S-box protein [Geothrix sp. PMB-07]WLT31832.1 PAS domain S-box protein [Geothrix sp. PMB-07]
MLHSLLQRQLKRSGLDADALPEGSPLRDLLERISRSYAEADQDRYTLERSLAVSSEEMRTLYEELKRTSESRLAESEQRYRSVVETVQEVIFHTDARGRWVFLNPAWKELTGFTVEESLGSYYLDAVLPEDRESALAEVALSLRNPTRQSRHAVRFITRDGFRWVEVHARPLLDADGVLTGASGTLNDIHDWREAEEQVQKQQRQLASILDTLPINIYLKDAEGRFLFVNEETCRTLGLPAEAITGRTDEDVFPPDLAAQLRQEDLRVWESGELRTSEEAHHSPSGTRWFLAGKTLIQAHTRHEALLLGFSLDITQRKQAENQAHTKERQLEDAIESLDSGFAMFDAEDRLVKCNQTYRDLYPEIAPLLVPGTSHETLLTRYVQSGVNLGTGLTPEAWIQNRRRAHQNPTAPIERRIGNRWVRISDRRTSDGGIVSLRTDVTRLKEQQDELRKAKDDAEAATRAKSDFLANMSHEIRTPMNGVLGMTGFLLDTPLNPEQREHAETVHACASGLLEIINDILDFSKIEAGMLDLEILDFDLRDCTDEVLAMFAVQAEAKGLDLACFLDPAIPSPLRGDPGRIRQILINLVGNAIKFTASGSVTIHAFLQQREAEAVDIQFSLKDTGIGISKEAQARLFRSFSQADGSMTRRFGGTGLGLAICRQLVTMMGGEIQVDSGPGSGSTFTFSLRLETAPEAITVPNRLQGATVLWVGPPSATRETTREQLQAMGLVLTVASSDAIKALDPRAFQIVLLQGDLPDGWETDQLPFIHVVPWSHPARHASHRATLVRPIRQRPLMAALAGALGFTPEPLTADTPSADLLAMPRQGRLLVAEDNPVNQKVAVRYLERLGFRVDVAANGLEALEACARLPYDLIFMDCQMPEMDGFEATVALRSQESQAGAPRIPIVALTAHAMAGERARCLAAGMDDYLTKPLRLDELARVIQHWTQEPPMCPAPRDESLPPRDLPQDMLDHATLQNLVELDDGGSGLLSELIEIFREDTPRRIHDILAAAAKGDALEFSHAGHALKGGAGALGAAAMRRYAADIEALGRSGSVEAGPDLQADLERLFLDSLAALEAYAAKLR